MPNPYRQEILLLLSRAECHYGDTLRDEEVGWSVDRAAGERNIEPGRNVDLRRAVRRVLDGETASNKSQAGHEDGVFRALLHFRGSMSEGLRQYADTQLSRLKAEFLPNLKAEPLKCNHRGANQPKQAISQERRCECGYTHAGECW